MSITGLIEFKNKKYAFTATLVDAPIVTLTVDTPTVDTTIVDSPVVNTPIVDTRSVDEKFIEACANNDWVYIDEYINKVSKNILDKEVFNACCNRNARLAGTLIRYGGAELSKSEITDENIEHLKWIQANGMSENLLQRIFNRACIKGQIELVKWLLTYESIKNEVTKVFPLVCDANNLEVAKLLLQVDCKGSDAIAEEFVKACSKGYLELAQWLQSTGSCTSSENIAMKEACVNGQFEVAKWLRELGAKLA